MKQGVFAFSVALLLSGMVAADVCDELPKTGPFSRRFILNTTTGEKINGNFTAVVEKRVVNVGRTTRTQHIFSEPAFDTHNNERVFLTRANLTAIAIKLGYERVESVELKSVDINGRDRAVVDRKGAAAFYHSKCADWVY